MQSIEEMINVLKAAQQGKPIEFKPIKSKDDWDIIIAPSWDFANNNYREKIIPRDFWLIRHSDGHYTVESDELPQSILEGITVSEIIHVREVL